MHGRKTTGWPIWIYKIILRHHYFEFHFLLPNLIFHYQSGDSCADLVKTFDICRFACVWLLTVLKCLTVNAASGPAPSPHEYICKRCKEELGMVVHTYNTSTQGAKLDCLLRSAWVTEPVPGQPRLWDKRLTQSKQMITTRTQKYQTKSTLINHSGSVTKHNKQKETN